MGILMEIQIKSNTLAIKAKENTKPILEKNAKPILIKAKETLT